MVIARAIAAKWERWGFVTGAAAAAACFSRSRHHGRRSTQCLCCPRSGQSRSETPRTHSSSVRASHMACIYFLNLAAVRRFSPLCLLPPFHALRHPCTRMKSLWPQSRPVQSVRRSAFRSPTFPPTSPAPESLSASAISTQSRKRGRSIREFKYSFLLLLGCACG